MQLVFHFFILAVVKSQKICREYFINFSLYCAVIYKRKYYLKLKQCFNKEEATIGAVKDIWHY